MGLRISLLVAALVGCGGPRFEHPACKRTYDQCINKCADHCDQRAIAPSDPHEPDMVETWGMGCQPCVDRCRDLAEDCEARASRPLP